MADSGVFVAFEFPACRRKDDATGVSNELIAYLQSQAQQENLESFKPGFMQPHRGALGGFMLADRS